MLQLAVSSDGIEAVLHGVDPADDLDAVLTFNLRCDSRRRDEQTRPATTEGLEQGAILDFPLNARADALGIEPLIQ